jgi:phosphatidylglycerol:prolipoprotein diacylglycerol transferase
MRLRTITDVLALPVLAGQVIGRLGNYFNQELFGYPTSLPWKIFIDASHRPAQYLQNSYFHPTFLYEMLLDAVGFAILWFWRPKKAGQLTAGYLLVFAIGRFVTEIWRISDRVLWGLSLAQLISLVVGLFALYLFRHVGKYTEETAKSPGQSSK